MRTWLHHAWTPLYLLILALGALLLFLYGFFPLKYNSGAIADWDDLPTFINDVSIDGQEVYNAGETSVVLMVVDALRHDFVRERMPYTAALVSNGTACGYVARAEPPTVTMPRIKAPEHKRERAQWRRTINFWRDIFAMMTGSVSTFADVALNFGAPAVTGDSVVRAAHSRGRRNYMYGDDTWLRLFPGLWTEYDGTTSFYVTDYTEVDNNVTRHLDSVLAAKQDGRPAFDLLVLHYLGLDHIGHLEGASSPKIGPKLKEMDDIVRKIFTAMNSWERQGVLMICGDHGMRDAGGHGGASENEVLVPLIVARTGGFKCPHEVQPGPTVAQIDLAPSIAYLLRAPIPGDSVGRLLPAVMPSDLREHLYLLHYNTLGQVKALRDSFGDRASEMECYRQYRRAEQEFARYLSTGSTLAGAAAKRSYEEALSKMAEVRAGTHLELDLFAIGLAILLLFLILATLVAVTLHSLQPTPKPTQHHRKTNFGVAFILLCVILNFALIVSCAITETTSNICNFDWFWTPLATILVWAMTYVVLVLKSGCENDVDTGVFGGMNWIDWLLIGGSFIHSLTFAGTSFIEEEHQTCYYAWNTLQLCVLVRTAGALVSYAARRRYAATEVQEKPHLEAGMKRLSGKLLPCWLLSMALHRFLRTLNQTGDRWAFLPDTADWLNDPQNAIYLHLLQYIGILSTFLICVWNLRHTSNLFQMNTSVTIVATAAHLAYRMVAGSIPSLHRSVEGWDTVHIVNVFWGLLAAQIIFEVLTFLGAYREFCMQVFGPSHPHALGRRHEGTFSYTPVKEKNEDPEIFFDRTPAKIGHSSEDTRLKFARSLAHLTLNSLMMTVSLLMRPHNIILVPGIYVTCRLASACVAHDAMPHSVGRRRNTATLDALSQALAHVWIGEVFFFYQGNSNSLATVDLNSGYVGLREYSAVAVAARIAVHAYSGPLIAAAALVAGLTTADRWTEYRSTLRTAVSTLATLRVYQLAVYTAIAAGFRNHLFVWSVFSPKLVYELGATLAALAAILLPLAGVLGSEFIDYAARKLAGGKLC